MKPPLIEVADLFCGAGGTSTGIIAATEDLGIDVSLLAVNHWQTAVNSHTLNHPFVRHKCQDLDTIRPCEAVPGGRLHLLSASPECTHHSVAAGGRPKNDQSRATAWHICRWAADLTIDNILIENVREFQDWGPLDARGKPIKKRKGETFKAFINALVSMGYAVEYRVQCAADFGDPTSRRRLLIMARRGKEVIWPVESHGKDRKKPHRAAREIIDWALKGKSIFDRKRPLSPNTMRRIVAGLKKFGGKNAEPFLVMLYGTGGVRSLDEPLPTVTAGGNHIAVCEPFVIGQQSCAAARSVGEPLPTIATRGAIALVEPFLIPYHSGVGREDKRAYSIDDPLKTVDTQNRHALVQPFIVGVTHSNKDSNEHSVDRPMPTLTTAKGGEYALVQPFLTKYYGTGIAKSVDQPIDTITTEDRFALVEPKKQQGRLDITLRMLQPHELSAAMSFPKDYLFYGTREEQVKQIGNAVPVQLARAHARALLKN